jgi:hypothetical protein
MLYSSDAKLRQWLGFLGLRTVVRGCAPRSATTPRGGGGCVLELPTNYLHCVIPSTSLARHTVILPARPVASAPRPSPPRLLLRSCRPSSAYLQHSGQRAHHKHLQRSEPTPPAAP